MFNMLIIRYMSKKWSSWPEVLSFVCNRINKRKFNELQITETKIDTGNKLLILGEARPKKLSFFIKRQTARHVSIHVYNSKMLKILAINL